MHRCVPHGQLLWAHVLRPLCIVSVTLTVQTRTWIVTSWSWVSVRIQNPRWHGQFAVPTRLLSTNLGSCRWYVVVVVEERLYMAFSANRGSRVFLMAPEHRLEVHKRRAGCFCTSSVLQCGCAPLEYHFSTSRPQTPCVTTQFNFMTKLVAFLTCLLYTSPSPRD